MWTPTPLDEFFNRFKLRPIVGCNSFKQVYIGRIER